MILDTGFSILDARFWILDTTCSIEFHFADSPLVIFKGWSFFIKYRVSSIKDRVTSDQHQQINSHCVKMYAKPDYRSPWGVGLGVGLWEAQGGCAPAGAKAERHVDIHLALELDTAQWPGEGVEGQVAIGT